jgi:anti-anti-sigma factor
MERANREASDLDYSPGELSSPDDELEIPRRREGDRVYGDGVLVVSRTTAPDGLKFAGEIGSSNSSSLADSIRAVFAADGDPHLDMSAVTFADISGITVLVDLAAEIGPGRRLLVHGLPERLQEVMKVTGWADLPGLELCYCEIADR